MNLNSNPTIEQLRQLIGRGEDAAGHHVLWVKKNGDVDLSRIPKHQTPNEFEKAQKDVQVRFEPFQAGKEYVGPEAAEDNLWISELFNVLKAKWHQTNGRSEVVSMKIDEVSERISTCLLP